MGRLALLMLLVLPQACRAPLTVEREQVTTGGGVEVSELLVGEGPGARAGERIAIDYTAWLADGTPVDSTLGRGRPVVVVVGSAPLAGWDEGLLGLAQGGRRRLVLPPERAYGEQGLGDLVPPGATLVFEVERVPLEASLQGLAPSGAPALSRAGDR